MHSTLIVLVGPSGVGKSKLGRRLREIHSLERVVTATTRPPRPGEVNGTDYHFLSRSEFDQKIGEGGFVEWARVHQEHFYGTPRSSIESGLVTGKNLLVDLDVQGHQSLLRSKDPLIMRALCGIFITPPSFQILEERIRARCQLDETEIARRIDSARKELLHINDFAYQVVNDDFDTAIDDLSRIIEQRLRVQSRMARPA